MKKTEASRISALLAHPSLLERGRFRAKRVAQGNPLTDFHQWANGRPLMSADLIERADGTRLHVLLIAWREPEDWYCVLFAENRSKPYAELRKVKATEDGAALWWRYRPSKRDGLNDERMGHFRAEHGTDSFLVPIPKDGREVVDFVSQLFFLVEARLRADSLGEDDDLPDSSPTSESSTPTDRLFLEGTRKTHLSTASERNPAARKACVDHWGTSCVVCGFDATAAFGPEFAGLIHVHHLVPLGSQVEPVTTSAIEQMRPVCPTCHAALHYLERLLTPDELKQKVQVHRSKGGEP